MPRFVILEHDHPHLHWDLMLEEASSLRTWRLEQPLSPETPIQATASFAHRLIYLDYEGPVSGNRGIVKRWDHGAFSIVEASEDRWRIRLQGMRCQGWLTLECLREDSWTLTLIEHDSESR